MLEPETVKSFVDDEVFTLARRLLPQHTEKCLLLPHRDVLIERLPKGGIVAEVGTLRGHFAKMIHDTVQPDELHIFDISFELFERAPFNDDIAAGRVILHHGDSSTEMEKLRSGQAGWFDWIYIDGDHTYEGVCADIQAAKLLIKDDGLLIFNDYMNYSPLERQPYGVARAVNDLILDEGYELVYFALNQLDYQDVAIRRGR